MATSRSVLAFVVLLSMFASLSAQWVHYSTPGIPRTPDGKPDLLAPPPKTPDGKPDLSGIWAATNGKYFQDSGRMEVKFLCCRGQKRFTRGEKETCRKAIRPSVA